MAEQSGGKFPTPHSGRADGVHASLASHLRRRRAVVPESAAGARGEHSELSLEPGRRSRPAGWLRVAKVSAQVCLVVLAGVALALALQVVAVKVASRADASEMARPMDVLYARADCPALDDHPTSGMTLDQLHDLKDQLCPTLSEPQRTGN